MSLITGFFGGMWAKLLVGLAIAGAVLAVLAGARNAGRTAERAEQHARAREVSKTRREIDDEVRRTDRGARRERLRDWSSGNAGRPL